MEKEVRPLFIGFTSSIYSPLPCRGRGAGQKDDDAGRSRCGLVSSGGESPMADLGAKRTSPSHDEKDIGRDIQCQ